MDTGKTNTPPVRVVGPPLMRQALESLLERLDGFNVVPTDHEGPGQTTILLGLSTVAVQHFLQKHGATSTVIVTNEVEMRTGLFRRYGLTAFVGEQEEVSALQEAITHAAHGQAYCSPSLLGALIDAARHASEPGESVDALPRLSEREQEIAELALGGWANDKIALHLQVSLSTVKYHLFNAYRKLGVHRRGDLRAALARQRDRPLGQAKLDRPV